MAHCVDSRLAGPAGGSAERHAASGRRAADADGGRGGRPGSSGAGGPVQEPLEPGLPQRDGNICRENWHSALVRNN